ncbi:MAG: GIY-YIG nuclease family protein [Rubripirellula sp.]
MNFLIGNRYPTILVLFCLAPIAAIADTATAPAIKIAVASIVKAFSQASDGFSSDELLIRDDLRENFLNLLSSEHSVDRTPDFERAALLRLLQLRKAGKLTRRATRRGETTDVGLQPIAEIAARVVTDRHRVTSDTMLADPQLRKELQQEAELILPKVDAYAIRKSVLALRKKRSLKPELVLQVADWDRTITTVSLDELKARITANLVPHQPGIYLFRNTRGYLYIGEAADLAVRLREHTSGSDRQSLADYLSSDDAEQVTIELHIFSSDSPAAKVTMRRAYESELIRSRHPKFNVRP